MILSNLSAAEYDKNPALRSSTLKKFRGDTPASRVKYLLDNPESTDSDALLLGTMVHALLLEPHLFNEPDRHWIIEREPLGDKTRLAKNGGAREAWELMKGTAERLGLPIVKNSIWKTAKGIEAQVRKHPYFKLVAESQKELSIFAEVEGTACKARYDVWNSRLKTVMDFKTSSNQLTNRSIQNSIVDYGYHFSAAMYMELGKAVGLDAQRFVWVFVESFPPYNCRFVEASESMLEIGREEFYRCLRKYRQCMDWNDWPGYSTDIETLDLPDWYARKLEGKE